MIFPRGARLITPAENQRFSPGDPVFCPTRKIRDFSRGDPLCYCRKILSAGNILGRMRAHTRVLSLMKLYHSPAASQDAGGIIPPHPHATALFLFHASVLSRHSAEKFRLWGNRSPTPPHYCFFSLPCIHFVKELRRKIFGLFTTNFSRP